MPLNNLMRRNHEEDNEHDEDYVISSAIISEQQGDNDDFRNPRKDYRNALLSGDAAIMKQLNVLGEFTKVDMNDSSCSDLEELNIPTKCYQLNSAPKNTTTLPLFPMIQLKRRRVM